MKTKTWHIGAALIATAGMLPATSAQPEAQLHAAIQHLFQAGNYSWRESRQVELNDYRCVSPYGFGRTMIDGYTIATLIQPSNLRAVFLGRHTAFELASGWRRAEDLTEDNIREVSGVPKWLVTPQIVTSTRRYNHTQIHEVLQVLPSMIVDVREENGVLVGSLGPTSRELAAFQSFILSGRMPPMPRQPPMPRPRSLLGELILPKKAPLPPRPERPDQSEAATFAIWLKEGMLTKVTLEFSEHFTVTQGKRAGQQTVRKTVYSTDILETGRTRVDIAPNVQALFTEVPGGP